MLVKVVAMEMEMASASVDGDGNDDDLSFCALLTMFSMFSIICYPFGVGPFIKVHMSGRGHMERCILLCFL